MDKQAKIDLAGWIIETAKKHGANEAKVVINNGREIEFKYRNRKLENLTEAASNTISISIYADNKFSAHSTNDMSKANLDKFIEEAVASTKYLSEDKFRKLPDPKYYPKNIDVDLELVDPEYNKIDSDVRKNIAKEIEDKTLAHSDKIISAECFYQDTYSEFVQVHSNGFVGSGSATSFWAGADVTVKDDKDGRPEDYLFAGSRRFNKLPDAEFIASNAVNRALRKIGQSKIKSGKYPIIVENRAAGKLLGILVGPLSARALQQKSSFLEGKLGEQIVSPKLTMIDSPFVKGEFGSTLYDGAGIAAREKHVIEKGVLNHYYIDHYYGQKLGMEPNCASPTNIYFEYGENSVEEMIKNLSNGILITGFIGGNSNPTTGDFSFGIIGQLIENGEIVKPVNEMNLTGNALQFWNRLMEVGSDPYQYSAWHIPSFQFDEAQISGL